MVRIPIIGKKKEEKPEEVVTVRIERHGEKPKTVPAKIIKPDVFIDEDALQAGLQGKRDGGQFQESKSKGIKKNTNERWDAERLRGMLLNTENRDIQRMLTVVRKHEFTPICCAETFDTIATLGEDRDPREQSFVKLFLRTRDLRAPSCFPEEGDSRKEAIKMQEILANEEQAARDSMRYGGGG
jgi:hypothetical protein